MSTYPFAGIGTLLDEDGKRCWVTMPEHSGCVMYGPYVELPAGSYLVTFRVTCCDPDTACNSPCGHMDVCTDTGGRVLVEKPFSRNDLLEDEGRISLTFATDAPGRFEFRIFTHGKVGLRVHEERRLTMDGDHLGLGGRRDGTKRVQYEDFVLRNVAQFQHLKANGASVRATDTGALVTLAGVDILVTHADDFQIMREIFIVNDYNFLAKAPFCVVDIGMNVGLASLYFATLPQVKEVYSFEPFQLPYRRALANLELNESLTRKITARNVGLGNGSSVQTVLYDQTSPIGVSTRGLMHGTPTEIVIEDAAEALSPIVNQARAKELKVAVKLDCEGSEFPIFESLTAANLLAKVDVFLIEWHKWWSPDKTQRDLIAPLLEHGFVVLDQTDISNPHAGQVYAIRTEN